MKRILSLTLSLALVALVASVGFARDVAKDSRVHAAYLPSVRADLGSNASVRVDTLFLFAESGAGAYGMPGTNSRGYTFDNTSNGQAATAGWTTFDWTAQLGTYWHLQSVTLSESHGTDMTGAAGLPDDGGPTAGNDFAWWCGREDACGWVNPTGYGTSWQQWLVLTVPAAATGGTIAFDYGSDFEGDTYDFFTLFSQTGANDPVALVTNIVGGPQAATHYEPIAFGDVDKLIFEFKSDGGWSDEDGSYISDIGAVWLDNFDVNYDGATDVQWTFEDNIQPAGLTATFPAGAGIYGALYAGLFAEDVCVSNSSYAWAFFDLNTFNEEYPIPVTAYGPPYFDNGIESPLLESAHFAGDPTGTPVGDYFAAGDARVYTRSLLYLDLPANALIYYKTDIAALVEGGACLGRWANDNYVYYGDDKIWFSDTNDMTLYLANSAQGGDVIGLAVRHSVVDMCGVWCNVPPHGDGTGHTPAPYFDMLEVYLTVSSSISWNYDQARRFQDNFAETSGPTIGKVRLDSSESIQDTGETVIVIGDSIRVELNMDGEDGILPDVTSVPGENRPSLYMYARVVAGPHVGSTAAAMGDPDNSDFSYTPHIGTAVAGGETWNVVIADTARIENGPAIPGSYVFDFAEDYFEPGDVINYYFKGTSIQGTTQTIPTWAESSNPDLRGYYIVRCLPTTGSTMLLVDDALGTKPYWDLGFRYNGYKGYDTYATQGPSSALHNGLSGRAEIGQIDQYQTIIWDSGSLPTYTITNGATDLTGDDVLLEDWLNNNSHNTCLWVMGDEVATDLGTAAFLTGVLGGTRINEGLYYDDVTGITVPRVNATHPALEMAGLTPYFTVDGGCPSIDNFDLVALNGTTLKEEAFAWAVPAGTAKAGIYNRDPDGNGTANSPGGFVNRTLFNPFSYFQVWDAGFAVDQGISYARLLVGEVLSNLCGFDPNDTPDGVDTVPASFALKGNFPNPFNPKTTIRFALAANEYVHLNVYDLGGRLVKTLVDEPMVAANHEVVWDGKDNNGARVASGVYFYKLVAGDFNATEKMVMLK